MKVTGLAPAILRLRNIADTVPSTARKQMTRSAERIVKVAKILVPRDTGLLEESIRIEKSYGTRGRLQIDIVAGGTGEVLRGDGYITLDQYASVVHEHYEDWVIRTNGMGPNTLAKQAANPEHVIGSKFLERAAVAEEPKLERNIIQSILQVTEQ
ncbi:HK97 gp10 family phage protein [Ancylobacter rudongensis]